MDNTEMETIIKRAGWTPIERTRRNNRKYMYASKRHGSKLVERYIGPVGKVMAPEKILEILK